MKTFLHITNAIIAVMALFPTSSLSKRKYPHRIFREERSKAAKAQGLPDESPFSDADFDAIVRSKGGKSGGTNAMKEILSKANKAGKTKCRKEGEDLTDFDLALNFDSLSMSTPMSIGKSAKLSSKCHEVDEVTHPNEKGPSYECVGDEHNIGSNFPLCPGLDKEDYCDGWGDCGSDFCGCNAGNEFCATGINPCSLNNPYNSLALDDWSYGNDWSVDDDWSFDDDLPYLDDDYYHDERDVLAIITWFMKLLSQCAGVNINFDSCLTQNIIVVLASFPDDAGDTMRMLRGAYRMIQAEDDLAMAYDTCDLPTEEEIQDVVNEALSMCTDVTAKEHENVLKNFIRIWSNDTCVCGYY